MRMELEWVHTALERVENAAISTVILKVCSRKTLALRNQMTVVIDSCFVFKIFSVHSNVRGRTRSVWFSPLRSVRCIGRPLQLSTEPSLAQSVSLDSMTSPLKSSCSCCMVLLHDCFGLPFLRAPWEFHSMNRWVMLLTEMARSNPSHLYFRLRMITSILFCLVRCHNSPHWRSSSATKPLRCTGAWKNWKNSRGIIFNVVSVCWINYLTLIFSWTTLNKFRATNNREKMV